MHVRDPIDSQWNYILQVALQQCFPMFPHSCAVCCNFNFIVTYIYIIIYIHTYSDTWAIVAACQVPAQSMYPQSASFCWMGAGTQSKVSADNGSLRLQASSPVLWNPQGYWIWPSALSKIDPRRFEGAARLWELSGHGRAVSLISIGKQAVGCATSSVGSCKNDLDAFFSRKVA